MKITLVFLMLALSLLLQAGNFTEISDLGTSAKTIGMGNIEGFNDSAASLFGNPASLSQTRSKSMSFFTTTLFNESSFSSFCMSSKLPFGTFAVGYMESAVKGIPHTARKDASENINRPFYSDSSFDYKNMIFKIGYQHLIPSQNISVGVALTQYAVSYYDVTGRGFNGDIGVLWDAHPVSVSFAVKNILPFLSMSYADGRSEPLATQGILGVKYGFSECDIMGQFDARTNASALWSGAVLYRPNFATAIQIVAGVKQLQGPGLGAPKTNGTVGLILKMEDFQLHYAYEKSEVIEFDNSNYFSVSIDIL